MAVSPDIATRLTQQVIERRRLLNELGPQAVDPRYLSRELLVERSGYGTVVSGHVEGQRDGSERRHE